MARGFRMRPPSIEPYIRNQICRRHDAMGASNPTPEHPRISPCIDVSAMVIIRDLVPVRGDHLVFVKALVPRRIAQLIPRLGHVDVEMLPSPFPRGPSPDMLVLREGVGYPLSITTGVKTVAADGCHRIVMHVFF